MPKEKKQYELSCDPKKGVRAIDSDGKKSSWYPNELRIKNAIWDGTIIWESSSGGSTSKKTSTKKKPV